MEQRCGEHLTLGPRRWLSWSVRPILFLSLSFRTKSQVHISSPSHLIAGCRYHDSFTVAAAAGFIVPTRCHWVTLLLVLLLNPFSLLLSPRSAEIRSQVLGLFKIRFLFDFAFSWFRCFESLCFLFQNFCPICVMLVHLEWIICWCSVISSVRPRQEPLRGMIYPIASLLYHLFCSPFYFAAYSCSCINTDIYNINQVQHLACLVKKMMPLQIDVVKNCFSWS